MKPLTRLSFKQQNCRKLFRFERIQQHKWPSPVFFFYILPGDFINYMDLDHRV